MAHLNAWNNILSCKLRIYGLGHYYLFTLIEFILLTSQTYIYIDTHGIYKCINRYLVRNYNIKET